MRRARGRASQDMTRLVLATYGTACHLRLKGCTGTATTKDHIVPFEHGGEDVLENYRPACKHCNSKRQNRVISGYGASIVVVIGPPAAGKSTYVREHARPADLVIDMDEIARALMPIKPDATHTYPAHVRNVAIKARTAAVSAATRTRERCTVWIIHAIPKPDELNDYKRLGYQVITVDPGRTVVEARARAERPEVMRLHVARWYSIHGDHNQPEPVPHAAALVGDSSPDW